MSGYKSPILRRERTLCPCSMRMARRYPLQILGEAEQNLWEGLDKYNRQYKHCYKACPFPVS